MSFFDKLPDGIVRDALARMEPDEREWLAERFLKADDDTKDQIEEFYYNDSIPTKEDLTEWFSL